MNKYIDVAKQCGFEYITPLQAKDLTFRSEVRDMCAAGRCNAYGHNWCCPPACPDLEEMRLQMKNYGAGMLVQTVAHLKDDFDFDSMQQAEHAHKEHFDSLIATLRQLYGNAAILPMGAGTCQRCAKCTYPDAPCRYPEQQVISMEAYGLLVSQVCESCGATYYYGPGTLSYASCILLKKEISV